MNFKVKLAKEKLNNFKKTFDKEILEFLKNEQPWSIIKWIYYYISMGGKRVRPFIAYETLKYYNLNPENFKYLLFALEIYHNSILILDDVQDNDELRRNKPSLWKIIGKPQAINVGFYGLLYSADLIDKLNLEKEKKEKILRTFDLITKKTVEGQFLDFYLEKSWKKMDKKSLLRTYLKMNILKTAYYLSLPVLVVLKIVDEKREKEIFKDFIYLGLLFQIMNDLEDLVERKSDIKRNLPTLPLIMFLDEEKDLNKAYEKINVKKLKRKINKLFKKIEKKLIFEPSKEILYLILAKTNEILEKLDRS